MKFKVDRIISVATLAASLVAIILVLKKPAPVAQPQAQLSVQPSGKQPSAQPEPQSQWAPPAPSQSSQAQEPQTQTVQAQPQTAAPSAPNKSAASDGLSAMLAGLNPESSAGSGEPNIKDQQISYDGDIVHGRFLTEVGGKDVWVTISGKMGEKDGYATFDPTEFKVGDMNVPVSLVNPALQRKLAEEHDRLKIPDGGAH